MNGDILYYMIGTSVFCGIIIFVINFLMNGFLLAFFRVKASRGTNTLVIAKAIDTNYFAIGKIEEGSLTYKGRTSDKDNKTKHIDVTHGDTYRFLGINCIDIDDVTNQIIRPTGEKVQGFDAVKINNLLVRALTRPSIMTKKEAIKLAVIFIIIVIGLGAIGIIVFRQYNIIIQIAQKAGINAG